MNKMREVRCNRVFNYKSGEVEFSKKSKFEKELLKMKRLENDLINKYGKEVVVDMLNNELTMKEKVVLLLNEINPQRLQEFRKIENSLNEQQQMRELNKIYSEL